MLLQCDLNVRASKGGLSHPDPYYVGTSIPSGATRGSVGKEVNSNRTIVVLYY